MAGFILGGLASALILFGVLFVNLSPELGRPPSEEQEKAYAEIARFRDGKFRNYKDVEVKFKASEYPKLIYNFLQKRDNQVPHKKPLVFQLDSTEVANYAGEPRIIWFGHSAFLLQIEGLNILLDPMLSDVPAPIDFLGTPRFNKTLPLSLEKLPAIDAVIISHDHYDHLDYESIKSLANKTKAFFCPLGVGNHLNSWGIENNRIHELKWWETEQFEALKLSLTPAQHFSGRGLNDNSKTLWGSWVIQSDSSNIYFSGDGGYGDHFKEIGEKFGPFDFAMLECGQYNVKWQAIHMLPEETAQAGLDLDAKYIMPIHWGAFRLALHTWTDPVERLTKKAKDTDQRVIIPSIGELIPLNELEGYQNKDWWLQ